MNGVNPFYVTTNRLGTPSRIQRVADDAKEFNAGQENVSWFKF